MFVVLCFMSKCVRECTGREIPTCPELDNKISGDKTQRSSDVLCQNPLSAAESLRYPRKFDV